MSAFDGEGPRCGAGPAGGQPPRQPLQGTDRAGSDAPTETRLHFGQARNEGTHRLSFTRLSAETRRCRWAPDRVKAALGARCFLWPPVQVAGEWAPACAGTGLGGGGHMEHTARL